MDNNNSLFPGQTQVTPSYAGNLAQNLNSQNDTPVASLASQPLAQTDGQTQTAVSKPYSLEDLESPATTVVNQQQTAPTTATAPELPTPPVNNAASPEVVPGPPRRGLPKKLLMLLGVFLGGVLLIVVVITLISGNQDSAQQTASESVPDQGVELNAANNNPFDLAVSGDQSQLVVNGSVVSRSDVILTADNGTDYGQITASRLTSNHTYYLPNANGAFCLDSNNCGYLQATDQTSIDGASGNFDLGVGLSLAGNTLSATTVNDFDGDVTIQGTANQVLVTNSNGTITLKTPQSIATSSSPTFAGLTVSGSRLTLNDLEYDLPDVHVADGVLVNDGAGALSWTTVADACSTCYLQDGNSFGETGVLGTNDNNNLELETNDTARVTIDTDGNVGISAASTGAKLYIPYEAGDTGTTTETASGFVGSDDALLYVGSLNDAANDLIAIAGESNSGIGVQGASTTGVGIMGVSSGTDATGAGVLGINMQAGGMGIAGLGGLFGSGDGVGVFGYSGTEAGVLGTSANGISGLFQSTCTGLFGCAGSSAEPTLVARQYSNSTANLIEAQDSSEATLFSVAYEGSITGVGNANVFQNTTDSTTSLQVLDADGGHPVLNVDTENEWVGIGTATPTHPLHVVGVGIRQERFAGTAQFLGDRAQGTQDAPTAIGNNTILAITGRGYDGTNYINAAQIAIASDGGGVGTNDMPGRITFATTADGAATQTERMRLTSTGLLEIGSTATGGTVEKFRVNTPTTVDNLAASTFATGATTSKGLIVQGAAAQTANLQEWQNSSGTALASVEADGDITTTADATIGSQLAVGSTAAITSNVIAIFSETYTATSGSLIGVGVDVTSNPSGASSATILGSNSAASTQAGNIQNHTGSLIGGGSSATHNGSGTAAAVIGSYSTATASSGAGAVTNLIAANATATNASANAVSVAAGLIGASTNTGTGTIAVNIGLQAQSSNASTDTNADIAWNIGLAVNNSLSGTGDIALNQGITVASFSDTGAGTLTDNYGINVAAQTAGTSDYGLRVDTADTQTLWIGGTAAGDGGTANTGIAFGSSRDVNLYRSAADMLKTDNSFIVAGHMAVGGNASLNACDYIAVCGAPSFVNHTSETVTGTAVGYSAGTFTEININSGADSSTLFFGNAAYIRTQDGNTANYANPIIGNYGSAEILGSGTVASVMGGYGKVAGDASANITNAYGMYIDTNNITGTVASNYGLQVKAQTAGTTDYGISVETADTQTLWIASNDASATTAAKGIGFGSARDVNLYRSAADTLKTDDSLHIATNLSVGTTPTTYQFEVAENAATFVANFDNDGNNANRQGIRIQAGADDGSGTTNYLDFFDGDGTEVGYCQNNAGTFACADSSDARTKTNIQDTSLDASQILNDLRVVDFNRIQNPDGPLITGFIAQEVQSVYGQAVTTGSDGYLGVARDQFVPILVRGHQNQQGEIGGLSSRITQLEQQVVALDGGQGAPSTSSNSFTSINVAGPAKIASLTVTGSASIEGNLTVLGDTRFAGDITIEGHIIGNKDTRGIVTIQQGETEVEHTFDNAYTTKPNIILTATNAFAPPYRVEAEGDKFTIFFETPATEDVKLNYQVQQ